VSQGEFPTPPRGGLIPPTFAQHPTGLNRKEGERGRGEEKGRDPQGLVDTPHVPNPEKYPGVSETIRKPPLVKA